MADKDLFLDCACPSPEHLVRYTLWNWDDGEPELSLVVQASEYRPWYYRLKVGLKYIFGFEPLQWHDVLMKREDSGKLMAMLKDYERLHAARDKVNERG